jgi:predicted DNA-binding protein
MPKDKRLQIRLSEEEYVRLGAYAKRKDVSMAQVIRDYIKRLPSAET